MIPTTQAVRDNFMASHHQVMRITMGNTVITDADIIAGGFVIDSYSVSGDRIEIGSAIASELSLHLDNFDGRFSSTVFERQELAVELGVKDWETDDPVVYIPMGYFTCDKQPKNRSDIEIKALDRMTKFDVPVDWSIFTFPCTLQEMVTATCTKVGVWMENNFSSLTNASYQIDYSPETTATYRDIIRWAAFLTATCARINERGNLVFRRYSWTGVEINASNRYSHELEEDDITITGVYYNGSGVEYLAGTADYALEFSNCDILQNNIEVAIRRISQVMNGFTYRPFEAVIQSAPFLQPMDIVDFVDRNGVSHDCIITHMTYTGNQSTPIKGVGTTSTEASYAELTGLTAQQTVAVDDAKRQATNYLSSDQTGIMVANMTDGKRYTPSDVPTGVKNTFIDNDSFDVRDGTTPLASFGLESQIGTDENTHTKLYKEGFGVFDANGNRRVLFGAVAQTSTEVIDEYTSEPLAPTTTTIDLPFGLDITEPITISDEYSGNSLTLTYGNAVTGETLGNYTVTYDGQYTAYITHWSLSVKVYYRAYMPQDVFGFTLGSRTAVNADVGDHSISVGANNFAGGDNSGAIGTGLWVSEDDQTAVGRWNYADISHAFAVGTGTGLHEEKTAFAVTWDGDTVLDLDTTASASTEDTALYAAIVALGWESEVLV